MQRRHVVKLAVGRRIRAKAVPSQGGGLGRARGIHTYGNRHGTARSEWASRDATHPDCTSHAKSSDEEGGKLALHKKGDGRSEPPFGSTRQVTGDTGGENEVDDLKEDAIVDSSLRIVRANVHKPWHDQVVGQNHAQPSNKRTVL
eukprot:scaffold2986_cov123-Isochrysis_galbana.AAC.5